METEKNPPDFNQSPSLGSVVREVTTSVKDLVQSEVNLVVAEVKESSQYVGKHAGMASAFGALLAISVLPFLAFLVIGLGNLMGNNFWLSSLIVAALCAAIGGSLAYREYKKIKSYDMSLPRTRDSMERSRSVVTDKAQELKDMTKQDLDEIKEISKRRAA